MMASAAMILVFAKNYEVSIDELTKLACLNIGVWDLVWAVDEWYYVNGDALLFTVIGLLGAGRVHGESEDRHQEDI